MSHARRWRRSLEGFHDGSLQGPARQALARHLAGCPACAAELARLEAADRLLRAARPGPGPLPEAVAAAIFERVVVRSGILRHPSARRWLLCAAGLPASAALALFVAAGQPSLAPPPEQRQPVAQQVSVLPLLRPAPVAPREGPSAARPAPVRVVRRRSPRPPLSWRSARATRGRRAVPVREPVLVRAPEPGFESAEEPLTALPAVETPAGGTLLVVMTAGDPPLACEAQTRVAPPEAPGFARVTAWQPGANGECIRIQVTVSSEAPAPQLVLRAVGGEAK